VQVVPPDSETVAALAGSVPGQTGLNVGKSAIALIEKMLKKRLELGVMRKS
jgi:hypothetical protein